MSFSILSADNTYKTKVLPILEDYCGDCHYDGAKKGGLQLDKWKSITEMKRDQKTWQHVIEQIESRIMPPPKEPKLEKQELTTVINWIENNIFNLHATIHDPGPNVFRRINRDEYNKTIYDIFGVRVKASEILPNDDSYEGFDHLAEGLSLSPLWMERLLMAADRVVSLVFWGDQNNRYQHIKYNSFTGGSKSDSAGLVYLASHGTVKTKVQLNAGTYKFEFALCGDQAGDEPVKAELMINGKKFKTVEIKVNRKGTEKFTIEAQLNKGAHEISAKFINDYWNPELKVNKDRNFALRELVIETIPNHDTRPQAFKNLFKNVSLELSEDLQIKMVLSKLAQKLYRKTPTHLDIKELTDIYQLALKENMSSEDALAWAIKRALISPKFIFLKTYPDIKQKPDELGIQLIDEYSLATRLSFFIWGTTPDSYLLNLASKNELRKNWNKVINRMLKSGRSHHLVEKFAFQWLELSKLTYSNPDSKIFKDYNYSLKSYFKRETLEFFKYILNNNRNISDFLQADYTIANSKLAEFYGLPKQTSKDRFVKVNLNSPKRGGLLGQGAILMMTSFNRRTSPVLRGQWMMEKVMGLPPGPPPPEVPELKEVAKKNKGKNLSLRKQLEIHRSKSECMSCHSRMDPLGFAMENFNGIGQWRSVDEKGNKINTAGTLISGEKFNTFSELKGILIKNYQTSFNKVLVESLLKFSIGRGLIPQDRLVIRDIMGKIKNDGKLHSVIKAILDSRSFQTMRIESK